MCVYKLSNKFIQVASIEGCAVRNLGMPPSASIGSSNLQDATNSYVWVIWTTTCVCGLDARHTLPCEYLRFEAAIGPMPHNPN
eukprot:586874-Amphidinium_carterae.1